MSPTLRIIVFACVVMLCTTTCREGSAQEEERRGINVFEKKPKDWGVGGDHTVRRDDARRLIEGARQGSQSTNYIYYGMLFGVVIIVAVGLFYWETLRQKRKAWELNDPMALVKELNFVHHISEQEKRVMQEIAERNALPSPLALFVEPKFLLEAWENDTYRSSRPSVRRLLSKLFDITTEEGATQPS